MNLFKDDKGNLRNIWWVTVFFLVLAALTFPVILIFQRLQWEISIALQAVIVIAATWICQLLRRKPIYEVVGRFNYGWFKNLSQGLLMGAVLMFIPALILYLGGWVSWENQSAALWPVLSATGLFVCVSVAEEFLFHGFIFQRLIGSIGVWAAQLIMAGYFLLIHINNPGMDGATKLLASVNIFVASLLFGLAFIKTKNLAMSIGIHFMANWVQGTLLGFGVSGSVETSLLKPVFNKGPLWLTGGTFGLEASFLGLVVLIVITGLLYFWD